MQPVFARQANPMVWDYAEANPFCSSSGNWLDGIHWVVEAISLLPASGEGIVNNKNAVDLSLDVSPVTSTDPPYYDNIGYADLSDFFYIWLRHSFGKILSQIYLQQY